MKLKVFYKIFGAEGRSRTGTSVTHSPDFESGASANSATSATLIL